MSQEKDDITYLLQQISEGNSSCFEKMYKRYFKSVIPLHCISFSRLLQPKMYYLMFFLLCGINART